VNIGRDYEIGRSVCPCMFVSVCPCTLGGDMHSYERLLVCALKRYYSLTAARSLVKFYTNTYLGNRNKLIEFPGHRTKVKVTGPDFRILYHCDIEPCCSTSCCWTGPARLIAVMANANVNAIKTTSATTDSLSLARCLIV